MTYIYVDLNTLGLLISPTLKNYIDLIDRQREQAQSVNTFNHDPAELGNAFSLHGEINGPHERLEHLRRKLSTLHAEITEMSSNGITPSKIEGRVTWNSYYLPDDLVETGDSIENIRKYNSEAKEQAEADAAAFKQVVQGYDENAGDGRTLEQVIESMGQYEDNPAYGLTFINKYGLDEFFYAPYVLNSEAHLADADGRNGAEIFDKGMTAMGNILAGASRSASHVKLADDINSVVGNPRPFKETANGSSFNAVMYSASSRFGVDFLERVGSHFEVRKDLTDDPSYDYWYDGDQYSGDPLSGVLAAVGRDPEAALHYFAPGGQGEGGVWRPSTKAEERWRHLREREWDDIALEGLAEGLAGLSVLRHSQDADSAQGATWGVANGLVYLAEGQDPDDAFDNPNLSSDAQGYVGMLLGNCAPELNNLSGYRCENVVDDKGEARYECDLPREFTDTYDPYYQLPRIDVGGGDAGRIESAAATLLHEIAGNPTANNALTYGLVHHADNVIRSGAPEKSDDAERLALIEVQYDKVGRTLGLTDAMARDKVSDARDEHAEHEEAVTGFWNGLGAIAAVGGLLPPPVGTGASAVSAGSGAMAAFGPQHFGGDIPDATIAGNGSLKWAAYASAIECGVLEVKDRFDENSDETFDTSWYLEGNGGEFGEVSVGSEKDLENFKRWVEAAGSAEASTASSLYYAGDSGYNAWLPHSGSTSLSEFKERYNIED